MSEPTTRAPLIRTALARPLSRKFRLVNYAALAPLAAILTATVAGKLAQHSHVQRQQGDAS